VITASAPAKIILFGEHAVVYGIPAIAIPVPALQAVAHAHAAPAGQGLVIRALDRGVVLPVDLARQAEDALVETAHLVLQQLALPTPDLTIELSSTIPMASGLGSGAAVSTALARVLAAAVGQPLDDATLNSIIYEIEKRHHGTPSGIDNTVIVYQQPIYFVREQPIERLNVGGTFRFVIGDTGQAASTKVAVAAVRELYQRQRDYVEPMFNTIGNLVQAARAALEGGDVAALGELMTRNHAILQKLTVSSDELDRLVEAAMKVGALGAKLSGGGRGGNMIALVTEETSAAVAAALMAAGAVRVTETTLTPQPPLPQGEGE
jgi:mevalonate kinase